MGCNHISFAVDEVLNPFTVSLGVGASRVWNRSCVVNCVVQFLLLAVDNFVKSSGFHDGTWYEISFVVILSVLSISFPVSTRVL